MKSVLQVLFGLAMGVASVVVCVYLGLLLQGQPDWRTGVKVGLLLAITQWVAFFSFRRHAALQVFCGAIMCMAIAVLFLYSSLPIFWEREDPQPHVYSITWHSTVAFLLLLAITQGVSFLVFHLIRLKGSQPPTGPRVSQLHG
jgi:hypothetical protein